MTLWHTIKESESTRLDQKFPTPISVLLRVICHPQQQTVSIFFIEYKFQENALGETITKAMVTFTNEGLYNKNLQQLTF